MSTKPARDEAGTSIMRGRGKEGEYVIAKLHTTIAQLEDGGLSTIVVYGNSNNNIYIIIIIIIIMHNNNNDI